MPDAQTSIEQACTTESLLGRSVVLVGYGNQGRAHALNLRDSGVVVKIAGRTASTARARAESDGFQTKDTAQAVPGADLVIVALPDEVHAEVWESAIEPHVKRGQTIGFIHGSSVHFRLVRIPDGIGAILVAPKGPGSTLRERFIQGQGIPALLAVAQERDPGTGGPTSHELARSWAAGLGCARAAVVRTTFGDEAETDLFGEQAVLCGGMMGLAQAAYETLVEAGYPPLLAYMECVHEIKQVADLLYARGPAGMRAAISNTAEFGAYSAAPRMVDDATKTAMRTLLKEIKDGTFTRTMQADHDAGAPWFRAQRAIAKAHPMEQSSADVRALMPWLAAEATGGTTPSVDTRANEQGKHTQQ